MCDLHKNMWNHICNTLNHICDPHINVRVKAKFSLQAILSVALEVFITDIRSLPLVQDPAKF